MRTQNTMLYVALALLIGAAYIYLNRPVPAPRNPVREPPRAANLPPTPKSTSGTQPPAIVGPAASPRRVRENIRPAETQTDQKSARPTAHYRVDDGVAVVQGDLAVGVPLDPAATTGVVQLAPLKTWGPRPIAYYIQPGVAHPEQIHQALALFANTRLKFVEYSGQEDALVFEPTAGICKSYLGKVGGRQPIWIAPGCGPVEIAHEIMHALGFAHEQNRADRDDYITVNVDGIEDEYRYNFDKLPPAYTKLNQAAPFDYTSIMMYPPWMFAKGGQTTMFPKDPDQRIAPGPALSPADERRINATVLVDRL